MPRVFRWLSWLGFLAGLIWAAAYLAGNPDAGPVTGLAAVVVMLAIGVVAAWWEDPRAFRS